MIAFSEVVRALAPTFGLEVSTEDDALRTRFHDQYPDLPGPMTFTLADVGSASVERALAHQVGNLVVTTTGGDRLFLAVALIPPRQPSARLFARALMGWATTARIAAGVLDTLETARRTHPQPHEAVRPGVPRGMVEIVAHEGPSGAVHVGPVIGCSTCSRRRVPFDPSGQG